MNTRIALLLLSLLVGGCVVRQSTYEQALISLERCHRDARATARQRDSRAKELERTEKSLIEARHQLAARPGVCAQPRARRLLQAALAARATEAELRDIAARRERRARLDETHSRMRARLDPLIASGELTLQRRGDGVSLTVPAGALFAPGGAVLNAKGARLFARLGPLLRELSGARFVIEGHTATGRAGRYWQLSTTRARSVARALVSAGLGAGRLGVAGFADHRPPRGKRDATHIEIVVILAPSATASRGS